MITEILHQVKGFNTIIAELKRESSYYPSVLIKYYEAFERPHIKYAEKTNMGIRALAASLLKRPSEEGVIEKNCYASTLVRIERNGKWYVVHCVESTLITVDCDEKYLLLKMMDSVYKIQLFYQITDVTTIDGDTLQDEDNLQQSEIERLTISKWN